MYIINKFSVTAKARINSLCLSISSPLPKKVKAKIEIYPCRLLSFKKALPAFLRRRAKYECTSLVHYRFTAVPMGTRTARSKESIVCLSSLDKSKLVSKEAVERRSGKRCYGQHAQA